MIERFTTVVLVLLLAGAAYADGLVIGPDALSARDRAALQAAIASARAQNPAIFTRLADLPAVAADMDARKRGPLAPIAPRLKSLGPHALLPMLELLAFEAPERGELTDSAWTAMRASLLEAVGRLRDSRAEPVLHAVLDSSEADFYVLRAAVEALGKLGGPAAITHLSALARTAGPKQAAAIAAIGYCRCEAVATLLAQLLREAADEDTARVLARSLSDVANSWAWKLEPQARQAEWVRVHGIAEQALQGAVARWTGPAHRAARTALRVIDRP